MRKLVFFTLFLILTMSNAIARESKKVKKYRASEFRKALMYLDMSYIHFEKDGSCLELCENTAKKIDLKWDLITKKLKQKRRTEIEGLLKVYRASLVSKKGVNVAHMKLKDMFLNYFKFRLEPLQRPSFTEGKALYEKFCTSCHGSEAKGDGFLSKNPKFPMKPAPVT